MSKCFVIQPFDGGRFDKRFDDVYEPAIKGAGLEAYRVDRDPSVVIPIDDIRDGIASASACLADITMDNPNVWFELGVAICSLKPVVLICSKERVTPFPFDVQHRSIIRYSTDSSSDFENLKNEICSKLTHFLSKENQMAAAQRIVGSSHVEGLASHEIAALVAVTQRLDAPEDGIAAGVVRQDMENAGFTNIATTLALRALCDKGMLEYFEQNDGYDDRRYYVYRSTSVGTQWLIDNQSSLSMTSDPKLTSRASNVPSDDVPF